MLCGMMLSTIHFLHKQVLILQHFEWEYPSIHWELVQPHLFVRLSPFLPSGHQTLCAQTYRHHLSCMISIHNFKHKKQKTKNNSDPRDAPLVSYGGIDAIITNDIRNSKTCHCFVHTLFTTSLTSAIILSSKNDLRRFSNSYVKNWLQRDIIFVQKIYDLVLLVTISHLGVNPIAETCCPC